MNSCMKISFIPLSFHFFLFFNPPKPKKKSPFESTFSRRNFYANLWFLIIFLICTWLESQLDSLCFPSLVLLGNPNVCLQESLVIKFFLCRSFFKAQKKATKKKTNFLFLRIFTRRQNPKIEIYAFIENWNNIKWEFQNICDKYIIVL